MTRYRTLVALAALAATACFAVPATTALAHGHRASVKPHDGAYVDTSAFGVLVKHGRVSELYLRARGDCFVGSQSSKVFAHDFHKSVAIKHGTFTYKASEGPYVIDVTGRFVNARTITGTVHSLEDSVGACLSVPLGFTAKRH